jgi:hypothetical protein
VARYAEDLNYWKSGTSAPDTWITRARAEIAAAGGRVNAEFFGADGDGRAMFVLEFTFPAAPEGERYQAKWPVLACRSPSAANQRAARIQAATMLYHDVKSRCVAAKVLGVRPAFLTYLLLSDGRNAGEASAPELANQYPRLPAPPPEGTQ